MPRTLAYLLLLLFPWSALGQNSTPATGAEERPKGRSRIGLALEGGGALGLAHIGVLAWFGSITSRWIMLREQVWAGS